MRNLIASPPSKVDTLCSRYAGFLRLGLLKNVWSVSAVGLPEGLQSLSCDLQIPLALPCCKYHRSNDTLSTIPVHMGNSYSAHPFLIILGYNGSEQLFDDNVV